MDKIPKVQKFWKRDAPVNSFDVKLLFPTGLSLR